MSPQKTGVKFSARELSASLPPKIGLFFNSLQQSVKESLISRIPKTDSLTNASYSLEGLLKAEHDELDRGRSKRVAHASGTKPEKKVRVRKARVLKPARQKAIRDEQPEELRPPKDFVPKPPDPSAGAKFAEHRRLKKLADEAKRRREEEAAPEKDAGVFQKKEVFITYWDDHRGDYSSTAVPLDAYVRYSEKGLLKHQRQGTPRPSYLPDPKIAALDILSERDRRW